LDRIKDEFVASITVDQKSIPATVNWSMPAQIKEEMIKIEHPHRKQVTVDLKRGYVTGVKDMTTKRDCKSSFAYAVVAAMESLYMIENL
jgi:hypothetical protein